MFKLYSTDDGRQQPWEYLPAAAITPVYGMTLYPSSGKMAVAATTNRAAYVCMREEGAAVAAGTIIPVIKIQKDQIWEADTDASSLTVSTGYDVAAGGLKVASTTNTANFIVTAFDAAAGKVYGRFDV